MHFTKEEYKQRLDKVKQGMIKQNIDLLILCHPANMNYLSGYDAWSFYVHQFLLVSLESDEPVWIGREQDVASAKFTTYLSEDNIIGYTDHYVQSTERHPADFVAAYIRDKKLTARTIGVESDSFYFTATTFLKLQSHLSGSKLVDSNNLVNWVRAIKSEAEISLMRQAGRIVELTMQKAIEMIKPGLRKCDLVAEIYKTQIGGIPEYAGDYPAIVPLIPSGEKTSACHLTWDDSQFENNQLMFMELGGCRLRYHCPLSRTVYIGDPPKDVLNAESALINGIPEALAAAKAGNTCEDVETAWKNVLRKFGLEKDTRLGYSIGLNYPPDWGEQTMSLRPGDKTVLQENMCFHLMPGLWFDKWGMEISEPFIVKKDGGEPFCNFPRKLFVK